MRIKHLLVLATTIGLILFWGCKKKKDTPLNPALSITNPVKNSQMLEDSFLTIQVSHIDGVKKIKKVDFFLDHQYIGSDIFPPYELVKNNISIHPGTHYLNVEALDENNKILCVDSASFKSYEVRSKYYGNFNFIIHETSYGGVYPKIDTIYEYKGVIKEFEYTDYDNNYFHKKWTNTYHKRLLTIYFSKSKNIICEIKENGIVDDPNLSPHEYQGGQFSNENSLSFKLVNGGLGGGYKHDVTASRL